MRALIVESTYVLALIATAVMIYFGFFFNRPKN